MTNSETLADILAEMRTHVKAAREYPQDIETTTGDVEDWADRIDAAAEREMRDAAMEHAVLPAVCIKQGDAAAMRAALESMSENLAMHVRCGRFVAPGDHVSFPISEAEAHIRDIRAALAAPPRNCDVGTAAEQYKRFRDYCYTQKCPSITKENTFSQIAFAWAQLPYDEGGAE